MPPRADAPLRKVTLNLYAQDCERMETIYGWGWTEVVRTLLHEYTENHYKDVRTVGDLLNERD